MSETFPPGQGDAPATWHLSAELCRRFLEGRVSAPERRALVRHLITDCPECIALIGRISAESGYWFGKPGAEAYIDRDYAEAFQAAFKFATHLERKLAVERLRGWGHWSALDSLLPQERLPAIIECKDWHHWGLFRALLDAARWYAARDPEEAADIGQLALDIASLLNPLETGSAAAANDMRAKAWVVLADCRLAFDLLGAREAIAQAWKWNEEGVGDPLDKAEILHVDAAYATAVGEWETAETILERAFSLYLASGEAHLQGRTLIQMGETVGYANPDKGLSHVERGLQLLNPVREPRLELRAQHLLAEFLSAAGRAPEALAIMDRARPLYGQFQEDIVQLRLHWLQGRIAHGLGNVAEAVDILRQVREEFLARDLRQDFLLVSIDLAEAHVAQGEAATALRLATEVTPRLASWNPHRNVLDAWLRFEEALQGGDARTAGAIFRRLRLYYRRHWLMPGTEE